MTMKRGKLWVEAQDVQDLTLEMAAGGDQVPAAIGNVPDGLRDGCAAPDR